MNKFSDQDKQCDIKHTENLIQSNKHLINTNVIDETENVLNPSDTNIPIIATKSKIGSSSDMTEKSIPTLESVEDTMLYETSKNATNLCLQSDSHLVENDAEYSNTAPFNGSTMLKEHLLEMASEVVHVLNDHTNDTEPTLFGLDLTCRNHILSTCLEDQQQLVNDLHIQVSHYVSII